MTNKIENRKILLGVCGGIAAYKCAELIRLLRKKDYEVKVVMTAAAQQFITPLTLQTLSGQAVRTALCCAESENEIDHITLARWADLILVAPATTNIMAKMAQGLADDLLSTLLLAATAPIAIAPAMNQAMWQHAATQHNLHVLLNRGVHCWGPAAGWQACGEEGYGRLLEAEQLLQYTERFFALQQLPRFNTRADNLKILLTAGPTEEPIDAVRFISNRSSGKMGYALANALQQLGAQVSLISGPTALPQPNGVDFIAVTTAKEMLEATLQHASEHDIVIATAAVADFTVEHPHREKIKKQTTDQAISLSLRQTDDILFAVAQLPEQPFLVGFAAETHHVLAYAREKLKNKKLDMIFANDVADPSIGFDADENALTLISAKKTVTLEKATKTVLAVEVSQLIIESYYEKNPSKNLKRQNRHPLPVA